MSNSTSAGPARASFSWHGATIELDAINPSQLRAALAEFGIGSSAGTSGAVSAEAKPTKADKPKAEPVVLAKTQTDAMDDTAGLEPKPGNAQSAATAATKPTAEAAKADAPETKAVTYAELQAAVLKLHKQDSTAAKPIAEGMGFPNFRAMPEDKWPEALKLVEAKLAEVV